MRRNAAPLTVGAWLFVFVSLVAGCLGGLDRADPPEGARVVLITGYDRTARSEQGPLHRSIDLPPDTPAIRQHLLLVVHPVGGVTYGHWAHTEPCAPGGRDMATGESWETDCSSVEEADEMILPPPDPKEPRSYLVVLDHKGSIVLRAPQPMHIGLLMEDPYGPELRREVADARCWEEGRALAMFGGVTAQRGVHVEEGRLVLDVSGTAAVRYHGWCDTSVA